MQSEKQPSYWAAGWATFAGMMLILVGIFHAISGLAQVVDPDAYVTTENYVFKLSSDAWGWIHLIGGIVVFFAGFAIFRGAVWGRTVRRDHRARQRGRGVRLATVRTRFGDRDHRDRHRGDLGAHGARPRRHRLITVRTNHVRGPLRRASRVPGLRSREPWPSPPRTPRR